MTKQFLPPILIIVLLTIFFVSITLPIIAQNNRNNTTTNNNRENIMLDGFHNHKWNDSFENALDHFRELVKTPHPTDMIDIIFVKEDKEIVVRRNTIQYHYLFYKSTDDIIAYKQRFQKEMDNLPQELVEQNTNEQVNNNRQTNSKQKKEISKVARLFAVKSYFADTNSMSIKSILAQKYGQPHQTLMGDENKEGVYLWDFEKGYLVQPYSQYEKDHYSYQIYYISKELQDEMLQDLDIYNFLKEKYIILDLIP